MATGGGGRGVNGDGHSLRRVELLEEWSDLEYAACSQEDRLMDLLDNHSVSIG